MTRQASAAMTNRRHFSANFAAMTGAALCGLAVLDSPAHGYVLPVVDVAKFTAFLAQLEEMDRLYQQGQAVLNHIKSAGKRLRGVSLTPDPLRLVERLAGDVHGIGFRLQTVSQQFDSVFPDEQAIADTDPKDFQQMSEQWDAELQQTTMVAARAQATALRMEESARATESIVRASEQGGGEGSKLAALQALVKMLGVVNRDMGVLASSISASQRVNASIAAISTAEKASAAQRHESMMQGYSSGNVATQGLEKSFLKGRK